MTRARDALVIGGGPAGASAAILLACAGWRVTLVEQHAFPRQKVCGECFAVGALPLLEELGVARAFRRLAGPPITRVGWMRAGSTVVAPMPASPDEDARYSRALGRDVFDALLLDRARVVGVRIVQPARVRHVSGRPPSFNCRVEHLGGRRHAPASARVENIPAAIVIDAHGSWEAGPSFEASAAEPRCVQRACDLFGFKASFHLARFLPGLLPVVALAGAYGGMVVADDARTTVALCVRRDALRALRASVPGLSAGAALESHLRQSCRGADQALQGAWRVGPWLTVGPLRPGVRLREVPGVFRVGNAAGESHPLTGEGMTMALQSSKLLVENLLAHVDIGTAAAGLSASHRSYAQQWHDRFYPRLRLAAVYAHLAMRRPLSGPVGQLLERWPALLTTAARFAGKARTSASHSRPSEGSI